MTCPCCNRIRHLFLPNEPDPAVHDLVPIQGSDRYRNQVSRQHPNLPARQPASPNPPRLQFPLSKQMILATSGAPESCNALARTNVSSRSHSSGWKPSV